MAYRMDPTTGMMVYVPDVAGANGANQQPYGSPGNFDPLSLNTSGMQAQINAAGGAQANPALNTAYGIQQGQQGSGDLTGVRNMLNSMQAQQPSTMPGFLPGAASAYTGTPDSNPSRVNVGVQGMTDQFGNPVPSYLLGSQLSGQGTMTPSDIQTMAQSMGLSPDQINNPIFMQSMTQPGGNLDLAYKNALTQYQTTQNWTPDGSARAWNAGNTAMRPRGPGGYNAAPMPAPTTPTGAPATGGVMAQPGFGAQPTGVLPTLQGFAQGRRGMFRG